jgi:hypothetical protein
MASHESLMIRRIYRVAHQTDDKVQFTVLLPLLEWWRTCAVFERLSRALPQLPAARMQCGHQGRRSASSSGSFPCHHLGLSQAHLQRKTGPAAVSLSLPSAVLVIGRPRVGLDCQLQESQEINSSSNQQQPALPRTATTSLTKDSTAASAARSARPRLLHDAEPACLADKQTSAANVCHDTTHRRTCFMTPDMLITSSAGLQAVWQNVMTVANGCA